MAHPSNQALERCTRCHVDDGEAADKAGGTCVRRHMGFKIVVSNLLNVLLHMLGHCLPQLFIRAVTEVHSEYLVRSRVQELLSLILPFADCVVAPEQRMQVNNFHADELL